MPRKRDPIMEKLRRQGCSVELRRAGHYKITTPDGAVVYTASTPSRGRRTALNERAMFRRVGLDV